MVNSNRNDPGPVGDGGGLDEASSFLSTIHGGGDQSGPMTGEKKRSRYASFAVIILVVLVAAGALLVMRQLGMGMSMEFVDVEIDYQFDDGKSAGDHSRILSDLNNSNAIVQVPLNHVQMNPFAWNVRRNDTEATDSVDAEAVRREQERMKHEARMREIRVKFDRLVLNSVMAGRVPVARISGEVVRVGDRVANMFTVTEIKGRRVELTVDDQVFELILGEP